MGGRARVSSGRRRPERNPSLAGAAVVGTAAAIAGLVVVGQLARAPTPTAAPLPATRTPTASPTPPAPAPTATALPTETAVWTTEQTRQPPPPTATRTEVPWPTPVPASTRTPTPVAGLAGCIDFRWTTLQTWVPPRAFVNIQIDVVNRCGRALDPMELWFEVRGYRQGDLVQTARGHPFDRVSTRFATQLTIGLPGSRDWYDRITVEILEPDDSRR